MIKVVSILRKAIPGLILLTLISLSLSCAVIPAQAPSPLPPTTTATPTTIPPTVTASPSLVPTASATALATSTPSATISTAAIAPGWTPPPLGNTALPADLSELAARVIPSVVSINVSVTASNLFGQPTTQEGAGSGWVIDPNGLIVTNSHVIEGAQNITVAFRDGRSFPAQQVVADTISDLAVIKINAAGLPAATLGDSDKLKQGMMVMAIGNALGQGLSVTAGWVSRLDVSLSVPATISSPSATLFDLIEISAPINPGNSGGPLIDMLGEVVGITNAKLVATEVENVGFTISTRTALPILQQLIQTGRVTRPYLGVSLQSVTPMIASVFGLAVTEGALITGIDASGPAARAGLSEGDVIVGINNTTITSGADAIQAITSSQIGQQVTITYYRGSARSTAQATLAQNPNP